MRPVHVLAVASEVFPLVKTGGLADVTGALPAALAAEGVKVTTMLPGYPAVMAALGAAEAVHEEADLFGGPARLLRGQSAGLDLLVVEAAHLYGRPGNPYTRPDGSDWPDNAARFAGLARMAALAGRGSAGLGSAGLGAAGLGGAGLGAAGFAPDVVHAHDWQAGLAMAYLAVGGARPGTVMTVHNLAFQGLFDGGVFGSLGLPADTFGVDGVEFYGMVGFLKAGLALADRVTTVSPTYAAEIQTPEHGMRLDGLLRARGGRLSGILNGIDETVWNPAADGLITAPFSAAALAGRAKNKAAVQARFGLEVGTRPVFGVISRLSWQKGLDLLLGCVDEILVLGGQLVVLGTGERGLEDGFAAAAAANPGRVGCVIGYDEALAHQMQAGIDALLVPSRFEPCGLTQLCALRYGAVPVVSRVGGLADTVIDANEAALAAGVANGIQFDQGALRPALRRAAGLWGQQAVWRRMQANGMAADVSWKRPARQYAALYREIIETRVAGRA
jgi:starch synthase